MFKFISQKIFGTSNDRLLKSFQPMIEQINGLEKTFSKLSNSALAKKTLDFKELIIGKKFGK